MAEGPLGRHQAKSQINRCLAEGRFLLSRHFEEELENDGLTTEDAFTVCGSGTIFNAPEFHMKSGDWKYRIEGYTADHDRLAVIFTIKPQGLAVFITVFRR
jgi:Domain of unknown function (DUF4258)